MDSLNNFSSIERLKQNDVRYYMNTRQNIKQTYLESTNFLVALLVELRATAYRAQ